MGEPDSTFIQVITTAPTKAHATDIAQHLLNRHLAGCVQVSGPITSSYWWEGKLETAEEWYCIIKTTADRYTEVEAEIRAVHKYEVPEVLAFTVAFGSKSYFDWLAGTLE
jgi:periplasmic divalent cation tolerance protein